MNLRIGDRIRWISKTGDQEKIREGVIYKVICANTSLHSSLNIFERFRFKCDTRWWSQRDHESYVINVSGQLYWPRVVGLELIQKVSGG